MDDWEQFFRAKSARRAKRERRKTFIGRLMWIAVIGVTAAGVTAAFFAN